MSFLDDAMKWATMPVPGASIPEELRKAFDAMPMVELAGRWCALQYVGLKEQTEETRAAAHYFDHLPHEQPERALEMVLAVLASEAHRSVKMELNGKLMGALIYKHGATLIDRIEAEARGNARLPWLLGGIGWSVSDPVLKTRLAAVADREAWRADDDARNEPPARIDFAALSVAELARAWIEQRSKPDKDQDDNWQALMDYESDVLGEDPDRVIDMILEILKIETNPNVLGLLAAGPLECVISMRSIDRIEREAAANERFRWLLGGVWYWNEPEELKRRLDAIVQGQHWEN